MELISIIGHCVCIGTEFLSLKEFSFLSKRLFCFNLTYLYKHNKTGNNWLHRLFQIHCAIILLTKNIQIEFQSALQGTKATQLPAGFVWVDYSSSWGPQNILRFFLPSLGKATFLPSLERLLWTKWTSKASGHFSKAILLALS